MKKGTKRGGLTPSQKKAFFNSYKGKQIAEIQEGDMKQTRPGYSAGGKPRMKYNKGGVATQPSYKSGEMPKCMPK